MAGPIQKHQRSQGSTIEMLQSSAIQYQWVRRACCGWQQRAQALDIGLPQRSRELQYAISLLLLQLQERAIELRWLRSRAARS